ncbi:unnamed protein product [Calypogeia fissa]
MEEGQNSVGGSCCNTRMDFGHTLSTDAIRRYSRQLLVPSFGVAGQERLLKSSALVVGCGGLGSPIALYLAAAGVGCLGLMDHDVVELSNLHRQVIHTEASVGKAKVKSAASACLGLNSSLQVLEYPHRLDAANAVEIVSKFDVVLDATDNLPTRYLLNDVCVVTGKPLVSGAALGVEGQVTTYNHKNGPCYRCLFPIPPPEGARQRCSDNGVIGVVPGIIGTFQALEAVKIAGGVGETLNGRMLILDAWSTRMHMVKLRGRNVACVACGDSPQISKSNLHQYDYERFTQSPLSDEAPEGQQIIPESERISNAELKTRLESGHAHVLLDVRDAHEYAISRLPNSLNIPFSSLKENLQTLEAAVSDSKQLPSSISPSGSPDIYVVCRRGNDSQRAVQLLRNEGFPTAVDVIGGLESWVKTVNEDFAFY